MSPRLRVLCVLLVLVSADPDPLPQPEAEAEAEAQAEADPQYRSYSSSYSSYSSSSSASAAKAQAESDAQYNSYGSSPVMRPMMPAGSAGCSGGGDSCSGGPPTGYYPPLASPEILPAPLPAPGPGPAGGGGSCALTDQCCNMDQAGCCVGGEQQQQCYTVWENKCRYANKPRCRQYTEERCQNHPIKSCRTVTETKTINIPVRQCNPQTKRTCFDYTSKTCKRNVNKVEKTVNWVNENLVGGTEMKTMCQTVRTCELVERETEKTIRVPRQQCDNVPFTRKKCGSVQVEQAPVEVPTMDYRTEYRQQCYNVPKPVCRMEPCQYRLQQASVCPTCVNGVPGPSCGSTGGSCGGAPAPAPADMCGACRQQNVQMCSRMTQKCDMVEEQVCQQVPVRVQVPGTKTVPQPARWEMKCEDITENRQQCKTVFEEKTLNVPVKECNQGTTEVCEEYEVPKQELITNQETGSLTIPVENCDIVTEEKQHCIPLPTEVICANTTISKQVRYKRRVCDRQSMRPYCKQFPHSSCENSPGQECESVPRQVCQNTCSQSNYCNTCSQFASVGGFQSCQTSTCPNFISTPSSSCVPGVNCP